LDDKGSGRRISEETGKEKPKAAPMNGEGKKEGGE